MTPAPSLSLGGDLGVRFRFLSVALEAKATLPVETPMPALAPYGGPLRTTLVLGTVAPCLHVGKAVICALAQAGMVSASAPSPSGQAETERGLSAALGARAGVELPILPHLLLRASGDLTATLQPVRIEIAGVERWSTFPVGAALSGGALGYF